MLLQVGGLVRAYKIKVKHQDMNVYPIGKHSKIMKKKHVKYKGKKK